MFVIYISLKINYTENDIANLSLEWTVDKRIKIKKGPIMASSLWSIVVMNRTSNHHHHEDDKNNNNNNNNNMSSSSSCSSPTCIISTVDWDEWDESFWTDEQRQWLETASVPREVYVTMSVVLSFVVFFGLIANAAILYVFSRFKRLRTPANVLVMNLTVCDFISCLIHPMAIYSAYRGRWSFGKTGCNIYATCIGFLGLNSIVTLSAIACERYIVITSSSCRPVVAKWRITRCQAQKACAGIWLHCAALVAPPWLLGWSSYEPEGVLVTCSWDYTTRTLSNRLYYLYLLFFGFVLPVSVLTFCYVAIFRFIVRSSREMTRLVMASHVKSPFSTTTTSFRKRRRQTDVRTAMILLSLAVLCFTAWTPYAIVSLIGQFGPVDDEDGRFELSPMATSIPAFLAKTAIVFDPLVYGFSHPQFRSSARQILQQNSFMESSANVRDQRPTTHHRKVNANGGTTFMMVTAGLRHSIAPKHPQYRSQSLGTSSAAVSWARNKSEHESASIKDHHHPADDISSTYHSGLSYPVETTTHTGRADVSIQPKRAMSLATILWERKKKKSVFDSAEAITRGVSCREESSTSNRCFWTCKNQPTSAAAARLSSSFIRSTKGDAFYLVDGAHQRPFAAAAAAVHLGGGFQDRDKMAANGDPTAAKRRRSDPDLIIRRRMNNLVNHSVGDLLTLRHSASSMREEPAPNIFVVVSIPDGTTTTSINDETVDGNRQLFESSRRQNSLIFDKDRRRHHQSGFGRQQHNSLSCPLISP